MPLPSFAEHGHGGGFGGHSGGGGFHGGGGSFRSGGFSGFHGGSFGGRHGGFGGFHNGGNFGGFHNRGFYGGRGFRGYGNRFYGGYRGYGYGWNFGFGFWPYWDAYPYYGYSPWGYAPYPYSYPYDAYDSYDGYDRDYDREDRCRPDYRNPDRCNDDYPDNSRPYRDRRPARPSSAAEPDDSYERNYVTSKIEDYRRSEPNETIARTKTVSSDYQLAYSTTCQLPSGTRPAVRNVAQALRAMPPEARERELNSGRYTNFTPTERELLSNAVYQPTTK